MSHVLVRSQSSVVLWDAIAADTISALSGTASGAADALRAAREFLQAVLDGIAVDRRVSKAHIYPPAATPAFGVALNIFLSSKTINSIAQTDKVEERTTSYLATIAALESAAPTKPQQSEIREVQSFFEGLQSIVNEYAYEAMMARSRA